VRVVYLVSTLRRAGPTSQLLNIVRHLDSRQFEPTIVTLSPEPAESMRDAFDAVGLPVRTLALSRLQGAIHRGWRRDIGRLLGAPLDNRMVLHSQGIRGDVIASRRLAGLPRVATARNYPSDEYPMKFGLLAGRWMARTHFRAFRAHPCVVACSSTLSEQLREHGIVATVIRNGVDTTVFRPAMAPERARLREQLGIPPAARVGVSIGALSTRKDPVVIVRAMKSIEDPDLVLVFVGAGELEAECRREAGGDPRIRFVGQATNVASYMRAASFLVSASRSEGLPNSVLEALACGLGVVLSDIGPHRELLRLTSEGGIAFPVGDDRALAEALRNEPSRDASNTPGSSAALTDRLGAGRMSQQYQELYLRLAAEAARP
jgi:glycosyltransferase involved in cell wall biosynthesis